MIFFHSSLPCSAFEKIRNQIRTSALQCINKQIDLKRYAKPSNARSDVCHAEPHTIESYHFSILYWRIQMIKFRLVDASSVLQQKERVFPTEQSRKLPKRSRNAYTYIMCMFWCSLLYHVHWPMCVGPSYGPSPTYTKSMSGNKSKIFICSRWSALSIAFGLTDCVKKRIFAHGSEIPVEGRVDENHQINVDWYWN